MHFLFIAPAAFLAPIIFEMIKAWTSKAQGDTSVGSKGFLTLTPLKFFEPIGFFLMLIFNIGWAQPVPTSTLYYKDRRKGLILTYTIPSAACLVLGMIVTFIYAIIFTNASLPWGLLIGVHALGRALISVAVINLLIPVHPFAAFRLLPLFLSPQKISSFNQYERPAQIIMIICIVFGLIPAIINPIVGFFMNLVLLAWM